MKIVRKGNEKIKEIVTLSSLRVTRVTFFEVITGVRIPVQRELSPNDTYEFHVQEFNSIMMPGSRLGERWTLPAYFQPVNAANAWDHRDCYAPLED